MRDEDGDEFAGGGLEALIKGAGLIAFAIFAVHIDDIEAFSGFFIDGFFGDFLRFVGRVIEDLNLQFFLRIADFRDGVDEAFDDVFFIEHGQLNRHKRERFELPIGLRNVLFMDSVSGDHDEPMEAIEAEDTEDNEVKDNEDKIKRQHYGPYFLIVVVLKTSVAVPMPYLSVGFEGPL